MAKLFLQLIFFLPLDKKPAAMQHGENPINLQMAPTLSKSASSNPSTPNQARDHVNQRTNNRSELSEGSLPSSRPALPHLSSSNTINRSTLIFSQTTIVVIVNIYRLIYPAVMC